MRALGDGGRRGGRLLREGTHSGWMDFMQEAGRVLPISLLMQRAVAGSAGLRGRTAKLWVMAYGRRLELVLYGPRQVAKRM